MKLEGNYLVCRECGGTNVQTRAWVDANTNEFRGESGDYGNEDTWCDDCEGHEGLTTKSEYDEERE